MNIYNKVPVNNTLRWTKSATDCINNHCVCGRCRMLDIVYNCHMKETVLALVKKYGTPEDYIEPTIIEEE